LVAEENTAPAEKMEGLPGIAPEYARRLCSNKESNRDAESLEKSRGMSNPFPGARNLKKFKREKKGKSVKAPGVDEKKKKKSAGGLQQLPAIVDCTESRFGKNF